MASYTASPIADLLYRSGQNESLDKNLAWLRILDCKCDHEWPCPAEVEA